MLSSHSSRVGWLVAIAFQLLPCGCGLMMNGTHQAVDFTSEPSGSEVSLAAKAESLRCTTPCQLSIERGTSKRTLVITSVGYVTYNGALVPLPMRFADHPWQWITLLDGALIVPFLIEGEDVFQEYPIRVHARLPPAGSGEAVVDVTYDHE